MPLVIALTGGIGSGKSSVAAAFAELGAAVVDTDVIAHGLTAAGQPAAVKIAAQFGTEYLREDGSLDRDRMRNLVFADPAARKKLEAILHPLIRVEVEAAVRAARAAYVVLVVPLLVETGAYRELARRVLVVDCSEDEQIVRVGQRSGLAAATVRSIMASQVSRAERLAQADDVIVNDSDLAALKNRAAALHRRYLELALAPAGDQMPSAKDKKSD
jgi:dephospho-CoA kinase